MSAIKTTEDVRKMLDEMLSEDVSIDIQRAEKLELIRNEFETLQNTRYVIQNDQEMYRRNLECLNSILKNSSAGLRSKIEVVIEKGIKSLTFEV